jgi:hypothetical protein
MKIFNYQTCFRLTFILFVSALICTQKAQAETALTQAVIEDMRNLVQLLPQNSSVRRARVKDIMIPGDRISTGRASLVDLRFNDGTRARIGEQTVFRFLPQTRTLRLSNGTLLLLVPPNSGITTIQTPDTVCKYQGGAIFVRHDHDYGTIVSGLTSEASCEGRFFIEPKRPIEMPLPIGIDATLK